jgi:hypothetical protein
MRTSSSSASAPTAERVDFYQFDVRSQEPAAVYVLVDLPGDVIAGQLPIFDELPGEPGYNDLRRVIEVRVTNVASAAQESSSDLNRVELPVMHLNAPIVRVGGS